MQNLHILYIDLCNNASPRPEVFIFANHALKNHRSRIADFVGLDLESGGGSRARICDESQGDT